MIGVLTNIKTEYGIKRPGNSRFIIVAPHAGGDDLKTGFIARRIARILGAYLVVNNKFFKPTNSKAALDPEHVEDFNKLNWYKYEYRLRRRKKEMRAFYKDILDFSDEAGEKYGQAVAIYIHGMNDDQFGVDLGAGVKHVNDQKVHNADCGYKCSGVETMHLDTVKKIKQLLEKEIMSKYNLRVGIGELYSAWGRRIGVQIHKYKRDDLAIQIEINTILKKGKDDRRFISKLISNTFSEIFG